MPAPDEHRVVGVAALDDVEAGGKCLNYLLNNIYLLHLMSRNALIPNPQRNMDQHLNVRRRSLKLIMSIDGRSSVWWSATETTTVTTSNLLTVREEDRSMEWTERRWPVGQDPSKRMRLFGPGSEWNK
jgi:hypothetical protein